VENKEGIKYMTKQKIALVCDWLTGVGGAEKVILAVHRMYPDAPIYTSQYRPKTIDWFRAADVRTGWLNWVPAGLKRFIPFLRQWYFSRLDLSEYDVVISITGAEAKAVKTGPNTLHVSYMHAPTQYYWTLYDQYIENPGFGVLNPLARLGLKLLVGPLRKADYKAAQQPSVVVANSTYVQDEIRKYYGRESEVVWPNVDIETIQELAQKAKQRPEKKQFIIYGRQVSWKRMDIAIQAAKQTRNQLLVIGDGPEHAALEALADRSEYITFLPRYNGIGEIVEHIVASRAYIFPSIEPFGIAPVESLAAGTTVIGLRKGGALDIIEPGVNGVFFEEQTVESVAAAMETFAGMDFDRKKVMESAMKFSEAEFARKLEKIVQENLKI
jgi:glycosyltransferase involved in cell wall biosynthesis